MMRCSRDQCMAGFDRNSRQTPEIVIPCQSIRPPWECFAGFFFFCSAIVLVGRTTCGLSYGDLAHGRYLNENLSYERLRWTRPQERGFKIAPVVDCGLTAACEKKSATASRNLPGILKNSTAAIDALFSSPLFVGHASF